MQNWDKTEDLCFLEWRVTLMWRHHNKRDERVINKVRTSCLLLFFILFVAIHGLNVKVLKGENNEERNVRKSLTFGGVMEQRGAAINCSSSAQSLNQPYTIGSTNLTSKKKKLVWRIDLIKNVTVGLMMLVMWQTKLQMQQFFK